MHISDSRSLVRSCSPPFSPAIPLRWTPLNVVNNTDGTPHKCEDPFLFKTRRGWHLLVHNQQGPQGDAAYAFSEDGFSWTLSPTSPYGCVRTDHTFFPSSFPPRFRTLASWSPAKLENLRHAKVANPRVYPNPESVEPGEEPVSTTYACSRVCVCHALFRPSPSRMAPQPTPSAVATGRSWFSAGRTASQSGSQMARQLRHCYGRFLMGLHRPPAHTLRSISGPWGSSDRCLRSDAVPDSRL